VSECFPVVSRPARQHSAFDDCSSISKPMKTNVAKYVSGMLLLGAAAVTPAQSTWNYFISDAGGGNSLLTWSVTGNLATPPGAVSTSFESSIAISISAPGIYADSYATAGTAQPIPAPDGSYFQLDGSSVYSPILAYNTYNAPGSGNDTFGLATSTFPPHQGDPGHAFLYHPGTQSALIPIEYSDFNPGTYQSQESGFSAPVTVNLSVGAVPEPSAPALLAAGGLCAKLLLGRRKKSTQRSLHNR